MAKDNQQVDELFHVPIYTKKYQIKLGSQRASKLTEA